MRCPAPHNNGTYGFVVFLVWLVWVLAISYFLLRPQQRAE